MDIKTSNFKIEESSFGSFKLIKLTNSNTLEYVTIVPDFGGNVNEMVLRKGSQNISIINGCETPEEIVQNSYFKGAKLVPFANRINNGKYSFCGERFQLPLNVVSENHAIHGFMYDKHMKKVKEIIMDDCAAVQLEYVYEGNVTGYPFRFEINIMFALTIENGFKCTTEIRNIDIHPIPVSDGWHPYLKTNGDVNKLLLRIPAHAIIEVDVHKIPTSNTLSAKEYNRLRQISHEKFDNCFQLQAKEGFATTELYDPELDITMNIWQETGAFKYNYLQVFIPPSRSSIAIEPMTSNIDALNNKEGLIVLQPDDVFQASYGVRLS